jgi:hypothetical protein
MNNHVTHWLNAYHDGELRPRRRALVEAHLEKCQRCQAELDQIQNLSSLLQDEPTPEPSISPDKFAAQVALRLPRNTEQSKQSSWQRKLWYAVPVAILVTVGFLRTISTVSNLLLLIERSGINPNAVSWLVPSSPPSTGTFSRLSSLALSWGVPFNSPLSISLILPLVFAIIYVIWLLMWWVDQNQTNINGEKTRS